jgi:hypothetical protein
VADNTEMSDVDFEDVSVRHGECFRQHQNCQFVGETYSDNFGQRGNYRYQNQCFETRTGPARRPATRVWDWSGWR